MSVSQVGSRRLRLHFSHTLSFVLRVLFNYFILFEDNAVNPGKLLSLESVGPGLCKFFFTWLGEASALPPISGSLHNETIAPSSYSAFILG